MYCTQCGTQNPDNARFCSKCGTPTSQPTTSQNDSSSAETNLIFSLRKMFIYAAVEYQKKGGENPFDLLEDRVLTGIVADSGFWKNTTNKQFDLLVKPNLFNQDEQQALSNEPPAIYTYYDMLRALGLGSETAKLATGALEMKMLLTFSQLQGLAEEKNWKAYEAWASELLEQAREVGSPHLLSVALWKTATGKFLQRDKRACRTLLDELDSVIATALRKQPIYTTIEGGEVDINSLVKAAQRDSIAMRKAL